MLTHDQVAQFNANGHLTVTPVFRSNETETAVADVGEWSNQFLQQMRTGEEAWYLDSGPKTQLRKLDNPVYHRDVFRQMAQAPALVAMVEQLIGAGISVFFSQVFMKPPEGGGPKPIHQDNFYFGPSDPNAMLTVWIALDDATVENGCLYYCNGSHREALLDHTAPEDEPYNLQVPPELAGPFDMTPAPVPSGGVSFHHGNTLHQSSANTSSRPRRAVAMHYLRNDSQLANPALPYDSSVNVRIS